MKQLLPLFYLFFMGLLLCSNNSYAQQDKDQKVSESDSVINLNSELKIEILHLRRKVARLQSRVSSLEGQVSSLTGRVNTLARQKRKTEKQYREMEAMAKKILFKNDSLTVANHELEQTRLRVTRSKESVEIAARALQQVLENEREKSSAIMTSFKKNFARGCTNITHLSKRGVVKLDEENVHKLAWIDNFTLTVNTCYALPKAEATNNVKVYFNLYRQDDIEKRFPLENNRSMILTPNLTVSDESVVYYEGSLTVALPASSRRYLRTRFFYEVQYLEESIASGRFRLE